MKNFIEEFKAFAMKGNVVDLAVAVVIGGAFSKIVSALVDNIITPLVGMLMGGVDFTGLKLEVGDTAFTYGSFIQAIFDFIIIAFVIFLVIKVLNKMKKEDEEKPSEPSAEVKLLTEIRDSLKK